MFLFTFDFNRKYTKVTTISPDVIKKNNSIWPIEHLNYEAELSETKF